MKEVQVQSQGWENPLEEGLATHCSIQPPTDEEPGRLQSIGLQSWTHRPNASPITLPGRQSDIHKLNPKCVCQGQRPQRANTVLKKSKFVGLTPPSFKTYHKLSKLRLGTSLVVRQLRLTLPMQGSQVRSMVGELDPTCRN